MQDLEELLRGLEQDQSSTDRTLYTRETPAGEIVCDAEWIESTSFEKAYPETTKEMRTKAPLACGHTVSGKERPFGGYCQATRGIIFRRHKCNRSFCAAEQCGLVCPRCGLVVSTSCCAKPFEDQMLCRRCANNLKLRKALRACSHFIIHPFVCEGNLDDE